MSEFRAKKVRKAAQEYVREHPQLVAGWYVEQIRQYGVMDRCRLAWALVIGPYIEVVDRWLQAYKRFPSTLWLALKAHVTWLQRW